MQKIILYLFLVESDRGSEFEVGWSHLMMAENSIIFTPNFEFKLFNGKKRKIHGIEFIRFSSNIIINFGICKDVKNFYRFYYTFFLIKAFLLHFNLKDRKKFFVTMVQILSPNFFALFRKQNCYFGPLGGQASLHQFKSLFSNIFRFKNFITTKILYKIIFFRDPKKIILCHPKLSALLPGEQCLIFPAITQVDDHLWIKSDADADSRKIIIFAGRKIEIKLPEITFEVFNNLSRRNPKLIFIIVGEGWKDQEVSKNFYVKSKIPKKQLAEIYQSSLLNVFLSFELAGYVVFEALQNGATNFVLDGFGGDYLCSPSNNFKIKLNHKLTTHETINIISEKIQFLLNNKKVIASELEFQRFNSKQFQLKNRYILYDEFIKFN